MTEHDWTVKFDPYYCGKERPIFIETGKARHYITIEEAIQLKDALIIALDDLRLASQNKGDCDDG